ncbi:NUDIX hydrolase [Paenibacillus sepulcri]
MKRVHVAYVLLYDEIGENILMVKNKGDKASYYTLPGGAVEQGETLQQAAIREVKEETGLDVELDGILTVSEAFFEESGHHVIFFTFRGRIVDGEIKILFPEEIEEITWLKPQIAETHMHIPSELKGEIKEWSAPYIFRGTVVHKS